jgi:hypothetical protein
MSPETLFPRFSIILFLGVVLFLLLASRVLLLTSSQDQSATANVEARWNQFKSPMQNLWQLSQAIIPDDAQNGKKLDTPVVEDLLHLKNYSVRRSYDLLTPADANLVSSEKHVADPSLIHSIIKQPNALPISMAGTDISEQFYTEILKCPNQSRCILPYLQLTHKMNIYLCKHPIRSGVRFYYLVKEGFLLHPQVNLVSESDIHLADYIIYLPGSAPWHKTECTNTSYAKRLIVLDEFDGHAPLFAPRPTKEAMVAAYGPSMLW